MYVGDHDCEVDDVTDTQLLCDIADTATVHSINNEGTTGCKLLFFGW